MATQEEMREKPSDHGSDSSQDGRHVEATREEKIRMQRDKDRPGGMMGFFSKMGNLPEWKLGGKKLQGKALNISIAWAAACGFLMFGYGMPSRVRCHVLLKLMSSQIRVCFRPC